MPKRVVPDLNISQAYLAAIVESSDDAIITKSLDGVIQTWNRSAERIFGYTAEEAIGKSISLLIPEDQAEDEPNILARIRAGERVDRYETIRRHKDGHRVPVSLTVAPILDANGTIIGISKIARDIGAQQHTERLLRRELQARAHLAAIVESSDDAIISKSLQGVIQTWNVGAERIFGYTAKEAIGNPVSILIPHDRQNEEPNILRRIINGERIEHYETVRRRKDGSEIMVSLTVSPIHDDNGKIVGASKIARDITVQQRTAVALRDAQMRLQMVIDSAPIAVFAMDTRGVITLLEGKALATIGLPPGETVGRSVLALEGHVQEWIAANVRHALMGEERTYTAQVRNRWFETHLLPLRDDNGTVIGISGVALDVSEQRHAQEELFRSSKLDSIGVLAGGIAHDFNNILTAIVGNLALARIKLTDDAEAVRYVLESEKAAMRARGLTQQLVTFARGGQPVKKVFDLAPMLESTVEFALGGANVRAEVMSVKDLWPIEADEGQMNQVLSNLVLNAQQAMPEGGVIEVNARNVRLREDAPPLVAGEYVRIDIVDHGYGIAPENLSKIFDPFFTTKTKGSGLGLTSVYRIVKQHGGDVRVDSEVGVGTSFHVLLPRARVEHLPHQEQDNKKIVAHLKGRILFMDDDEAIRGFAADMLRMLNYDVVLARNGQEALQRYRENVAQGTRFDAVILDLTIRDGMGGLETLQQLRAFDSEVLAIVSSGYSSNPVLAEYQQHGFAGQLAKPYTPEAISKVLNDAIARRPSKRNGPPHVASV